MGWMTLSTPTRTSGAPRRWWPGPPRTPESMSDPGSGAEGRLPGCQLAAIVDEDELVVIGAPPGASTGPVRSSIDVGEVVLALRVGTGQAIERGPQLGAVEDIDPPVAFHRHRLARGRGPRSSTMRRMWPSSSRTARPRAGRIGGGCRAAGVHARGDAARAARSRGQGLGSDQGGVADHDQDGTVTSLGCWNAPDASPVPRGAILLDADRSVPEQMADRARHRAAVTTIGVFPVAALRGLDDIEDERATAERMKDLGESPPHPFALPGGEDHRVGPVTHVPASIRARRSRASGRRPYHEPCRARCSISTARSTSPISVATAP